MLPEPGSLVRYGRTTYKVIRPGCATGMKHCSNGDNAVTVQQMRWSKRLQAYEPYFESTLCLDGSLVTPLEES